MINSNVFKNLFFLSLLLCILMQYIYGSEFVKGRYIFILFFPIVFIQFLTTKNYFLVYIYFFSYLFFFIFTIGIIRQDTNSINYLLSNIFNILIAIFILKNRISPNVPLLFLIIFSIYIITCFTIGIDMNEVFSETSRNSISWIALSSSSLYYLLNHINYNKDGSIIPAFLCLFLSILAQGRSGIIISLFLFISIMITTDFSGSRNKFLVKTFYVTIIIIITTASSFYFSDFIYHQLNYLNEKQLSMVSRNAIWTYYFDNLSFLNLLLGLNLKSDPFFQLMNYNLHNSYLMAHARYGFVAFPLIAFIWWACISSFLNKETRVLAISLLCLLVRIFSDSLAFVGDFDFVLFLYPICIFTLRNRSFSTGIGLTKRTPDNVQKTNPTV